MFDNFQMTKVKFNIPEDIQTKIILYDILGKETATLLNKTLQPGDYEIDLDSLNLLPGTYYCKLTTHGFSETKKMILTK